jgi:hypothetical protein
MTELELFKWITDNNIEWHWEDNDGADDVIIFVNDHQLEGFFELVDSSFFDDVFTCVLRYRYLAIWIAKICDYYGIELEAIFDKD